MAHMLMDDAARPTRRLADPGERRRRALDVLRRAEARVGVRAPASRGLAVEPSEHSEHSGRSEHNGPSEPSRPSRPSEHGGLSGHSGLSRPSRQGEPSEWAGGRSAALLPVPAPFRPVIAGLPVGGAAVVDGSLSLLLAFAAAATNGPEREEAWVAVVGMPDLCLAAAAEAGLDLNRIVVVPDPGEQAAPVVAAAVDGFEVVLLGPAAALRPRELRSLLNRVRHRSGLLLTTEPCPGAALVVRATGRTWHGVERGYGLLTAQELRVRITGRGVDRDVRVGLGRQGIVPVDRAEGAPTESIETAESAETTEPTGTTESAEPIEPLEPIETAELFELEPSRPALAG